MKHADHSVRTQRAKILQALRRRPMSTLELRHGCDVLGVAPRIWELRHIYGHNIRSHWSYGKNPGGAKHRIVIYTLFSGHYMGNRNER